MTTESPRTGPCVRGHAPAWQRTAQGKWICPDCRRENNRKHATSAPTKPATSARSTVRHSPVSHAIASALAPASRTFLQLANDYLTRRDELSESTLRAKRARLALLAPLHQRPAASITLPEIITVLEDVQNTGDRRETAHRCKMLVQEVMAYAAQRGHVAVNVAPPGAFKRVLKAIKVVSHPAITEPSRFGELLRFCRDYRLSARRYRHVAAALRLAPLLFVRPGELRGMEWSEVNLERAEWVIPEGRMKMRRPHLVPLSTQAVAILREQHKHTGTGRYVFPSDKSPEISISENALSSALDFFCSRSDHTPHGFRSSASTLLNGELHVDSALIELQLAHRKADKIAAIYDRSERVPERRQMMQAWADYCDRLRAEASKQFSESNKAPKSMPSDLSSGLWAVADETG
jgi:integrase